MSSGPSSRPPRRDDRRRSADRSRPQDRRSSGKPGGKPDAKRGGKPDAKRGGKPDGRSSGRPAGKSTGRPAAKSGGRSGGKPAGRPPRPQTEAERRAQEVRARRAPREPRDPDLERRRIEERTTEQWVDEGSVRRAASAATARASVSADEPRPRRSPKPLDPEVSAELVEALGKQRGTRLAERLAQASEALDRERFQESRRLAAAIAKEAPTVAAAHEILGLSQYRLGRYKQAAAALQTAQDLHAEPALLPVIADCQRAQGRWAAVEEVWDEIKAASPSHDVMAEGRIVAAGARADQGDLRGALDVMEPATKRPKVVREFHLRQWYVLGDLYDRIGDPIAARRWFGTVADFDDEYADVASRLRGLGR